MTTKIFEVLHVAVAGLALMVATGCAASSPNTSGETHFVTCHETSECVAKLGPDYTCVDDLCKETLDGSLGSGGAVAAGGSGGGGATSGGASSSTGSVGGTSDGGPALIDSGPTCAACGGGTCTNGRCLTTVVLSPDSAPGQIAVQGGVVYWASDSSGSCGVQKVSLTGGTPVQLSTCVIPPLEAMAVHGSYVYEIDFGYLQRTPIGGGATVRMGEGYRVAMGFAFDASYAYWRDTDDGEVWRTSLTNPDGGFGSTLLAFGLNGDSNVALARGRLYFADDPFIVSSPLDGGPTADAGSGGVAPKGSRIVATGQTHVENFSADEANLYWTTAVPSLDSSDLYADGEVRALPLDGLDASAPRTLASEPGPIFAMIVDGTNVYWSSGETVKKVSLLGGPVTTLVAAFQPGWLAVDGEALYFTESDRSIMRLSPK